MEKSISKEKQVCAKFVIDWIFSSFKKQFQDKLRGEITFVKKKIEKKKIVDIFLGSSKESYLKEFSAVGIFGNKDSHILVETIKNNNKKCVIYLFNSPSKIRADIDKMKELIKKVNRINSFISGLYTYGLCYVEIAVDVFGVELKPVSIWKYLKENLFRYFILLIPSIIVIYIGAQGPFGPSYFELSKAYTLTFLYIIAIFIDIAINYTRSKEYVLEI